MVVTSITAYSLARHWVEDGIQRELAGVAQLKTEQIERWLDERRLDVQVVAATPMFVSGMRRWLADGQQPALAGSLLAHLATVSARAGFSHFCLRSATDGAPLLTVHCHADTPALREMAVNAARRNAPQLEDFHDNEEGPAQLDLGLFSPIVLGDDGAPGVVAHVSMDPGASLFPRLQEWSGASRSAETLLVRRDGDDVLYLNTLRYRDDRPLTLKRPLGEDSLIATWAVQGALGLVKGLDYRGVPSVAYIVPVRGTPWFLVTKMDQAEADAWLDRLSFSILTSVALVLLVSFWWWTERQRQVAMQQQQSVTAAVLADRIDYLSRYTRDCILLVALDGRILDANDQCLRNYGWQAETLLPTDAHQLITTWEPSGQLPALWSRLSTDGALLVETEHARCNESPGPIELRLRAFTVNGERCIEAIIRDIGKRVRALRALTASEAQLAAFFRASSSGMFILDPQLLITKANELLGQAANRSVADCVGQSLSALFPDLSPQLDPMFRHAIEFNQRFHNMEVSGPLPSDPSSTRYWMISCAPIEDGEQRPMALGGVITDITERKAAESHVLALSHLYAALSTTNSAIARGQSLLEVFRAVCQACVEHGHFRLAWVGMPDAVSRRIAPVEARGLSKDYLDHLLVTTDDQSPTGRGPTGTAYRENRPIVSNDIALDQSMTPWVEQALAHGLRASMALPIGNGAVPEAVLTVYADEAGFFDEQAITLLEDLARTLSFAFDHFRRQDDREQAEAALARKAEELAEAQHIAQTGSWQWNFADNEFTCSTELRSLTGCCSRQVPCGSGNFSTLFTAGSVADFESEVSRAMVGGSFAELEMELQSRENGQRWLLARADVRKNHEGRIIGLHGTMQDITERKRVREQLERYAVEIEDLYQNAPCGYHSLDGEARFCLINNTEVAWLGYSRHELVSRMRLTDILSPASQRQFSAAFPMLIERGYVRDLELDFIRRDGSVLPVLINATAIYDADGRFVMTRTMVLNMTDRKTMEQERQRQALRLTDLSHRLISVQEDERRRLSTELHDRTSPNLAALDINLRSLTKKLRSKVTPDTAALLEDASALLAVTAEDVRAICAELRPPVLDYAGLVPALESYALQYSTRIGIAVTVTCQSLASRLDRELEATLYRIVQEALTNCAKHAQARQVHIGLELSDHCVDLAIVDDGIGFATDGVGQTANSSGLGLLSMRERAQFGGGSLQIQSSPGQGTRLSVRMPLHYAAYDQSNSAARIVFGPMPNAAADHTRLDIGVSG
jgi:PAS domain S-box-containing protein